MRLTLPAMPDVYQPMSIDIFVTKMTIAFKQRVLWFQLRLADVFMSKYSY